VARYWPVYLTHWTLVAVAAYLAVAALATYRAQQGGGGYGGYGGGGGGGGGGPDDEPLPWFVRASFLLHTIALPASFIVMTLFWTLVYKPGAHVVASTFFVHGVNFVVMAADAFVSSQPYHLAKGVYFFLYCLAYSIFSLVYYKCGGVTVVNGRAVPYIYAALDWSKHPEGAGLLDAALVFVGVPSVSFACWFALYSRHHWLPACCRNTPARPPYDYAFADDDEEGAESAPYIAAKEGTFAGLN
jgi:hypothetical protein